MYISLLSLNDDLIGVNREHLFLAGLHISADLHQIIPVEGHTAEPLHQTHPAVVCPQVLTEVGEDGVEGDGSLGRGEAG